VCKLYSSHTAMHNTQNSGKYVFVKLVPYAEEVTEEYQGGFWRGRTTVDQIFFYEQILQNVGREYRCTPFIDFQAAYD
jgi:hypothetical protein